MSNREFKVGDIVDYESIRGSGIVSRNHEIYAIEQIFTVKVAWITRIRGFVDMDALTHSEIERDV